MTAASSCRACGQQPCACPGAIDPLNMPGLRRYKRAGKDALNKHLGQSFNNHLDEQPWGAEVSAEAKARVDRWAAKQGLVQTQWDMQRVMATMGLRARPVGQSDDEAEAVYYAFCPWEEFSKLSAIGHGPNTTRAIEHRRLTKDKPEAPAQLVDYCRKQATEAMAYYQSLQRTVKK